MSRWIQIPLELNIDLDVWEGYEDVATELIVEDAFENYIPKDGTNLTIKEKPPENTNFSIIEKPEEIKNEPQHYFGLAYRGRFNINNPPNGDD